MENIIPHDFFYFFDKIWTNELTIQHKNDWWFNEVDNSIVEQVLKHKSVVYKPTPGEPFKFFSWFFKEGFIRFIEYSTNETNVSFNVDLKKLLELAEAKTESILTDQISKCFDISQGISALQFHKKTNSDIPFEDSSIFSVGSFLISPVSLIKGYVVTVFSLVLKNNVISSLPEYESGSLLIRTDLRAFNWGSIGN